MNEPEIQIRWTRAAQMLFMAAALSGSAACNVISGASAIMFTGQDADGTSAGGGSGPDATPIMGEREQIRCKDKGVMVAVEGSYGSWVDSVSVTCAELNGDGTLGTPYPSTEFGGPMAQDQKPYTAGCQPGQVVGALNYTHDKQDPIYIFQVSVGCATVSDWKNSGMVTYSKYDGANVPDRVGEMPLSLTCKPGEIADGVDVLVGEDDMSIHVRSFDTLHCIEAPVL